MSSSRQVRTPHAVPAARGSAPTASAPSASAPPSRAPRPPLGRTVWRAWVVGPLVFGLAGLPFTLVGQVRRVARIRQARLDTTATPPSGAGTGVNRPVLASVLTVPLLAVAFVLTLLVVYLGYFGELYPLRPDTIGRVGSMFQASPESANAWGGPLLVGAWFVHAMVAVGMQVCALAGIRGLGALCGGVSRRLLGG